MEFPKLKLPSDNYSVSQSIQDKKRMGSFADLFYTINRRYRQNHPVSYASYGPESLATKRNACSKINEYHEKMRCNLDLEMQEVILERNGVIDSWPDSSDGATTFDEIYPFMFDYFGEDYVASKSGKIHRKSTELIYQNHYHFPNTKEYHSLQREKDKLKQNVNEAKKRGDGAIVGFISLLLAIYLLLGLFIVVSQMFFHLGDKIFEPLYEINSQLALWANLPYTLYLIVVEFCGDSGNALIVCSGILLACYVFGVLYFLSIYSTCKSNTKARKEAKKALNALINSDHYKQVVSENEKLRKLNEEMAEQWHRAWFEWVCKAKGCVREVDDAYTKEFFDNFKEKVDNTDFNELIRKEKAKR